MPAKVKSVKVKREMATKVKSKKMLAKVESEMPAKVESDESFMEELCHKFEDVADTIPEHQWGFNPEVFELLREKRHEAVKKAVSAKLLLKMPKKEKSQLGRILLPANTVTEIIKWIGTTHLSKVGIPKRPETLMNNKKNTGVIKKKDEEASVKGAKEKRKNQKQSKKKQSKSKGKIQKKKPKQGKKK